MAGIVSQLSRPCAARLPTARGGYDQAAAGDGRLLPFPGGQSPLARQRCAMSAAQPRPAPLPQTYTFGEIEPGHYQLTIMPLGIQFDIDRLRRERGELKGE